MARQVYQVDKKNEFVKAGATDLIQLIAAPGANQLFVRKGFLEILVASIASGFFIHLSGPTGTAKSSLLEALSLVPENFYPICKAIGFAAKPLMVFPIEMATFETPGELYQRRALKDGSTFDEKSVLVQSLEKAVKIKEKSYPLIWLREMGRVHTATVQGGLLDLLTAGDILLPDGTRLDGRGIAWVADSNYQAEQDSTHTLVTLDDALRRRFSINLTLNHLSTELEATVLTYLLKKEGKRTNRSLINNIVKLGDHIRKARAEGNMQSVAPPTIYGYLTFYRMSELLPHLDLGTIAESTILGNASGEDLKTGPAMFNKVFGLIKAADEEPVVTENCF